ncbi:hypothetical protein PV08_06948 [Exophiala spinifera]|uniref:Heterokaryon incompatibility domain-containing protein n=1 Tax=Exophiala spinifera TaxID=91928 RepID=A0A0D1ZMW5_9EURO|nr:uncharacterized protein PV08_06948 [Exophiala spinifera]KIW14167.1 hypothetical protein PV08_06948 [Exophiala spinifera]
MRKQNSIRPDGDLKLFSPVHAGPHLPGSVCVDEVFEDCNRWQITDIVMQSCVPLVRVRESSVETVHFHPESREVPFFVVISNVRSQGLGNTQQNALPVCQLSRLQTLVNDLYPADHQPPYFWIDTACIPLTEPGKSMAFELFDGVCRCASIVLVLDCLIEGSVITGGCDDLRVKMKSTWWSRLWTVSEGALAPSLRFQFKGGSVSLEALLDRCPTDLLGHAAHLSLTCAGMQDMHCTPETRAKEEDFLDASCLFKRDHRVYLGIAPGTVRDPSRRLKKDRLRSLLFDGYWAVSRYQLFLAPTERMRLALLRQKIEEIYHGLTYEALIAEQRLSIAGTICRFNLLISHMTTLSHIAAQAVERTKG